MVYADTDFFLALLKPNDWLREQAVRLHKEYGRDLTTSVATVIEVLLIGHRHSIDPEIAVGSIFALVPNVTGIDDDTASIAAHLIKKQGLNVFDAFHAAFCGNDVILSSDHVFDRIGMKRIKLEKA